MNKKYALITVSDKSGVEMLALGLEALGYAILSTSGTAKYLKEFCREVVLVEDVTGFPEILDGRVKTLHPVIHAGILADRAVEEHMRTLVDKGISQIDVVAVNLYPFAQTLAKPDSTDAEIIENIDIGGPALVRAAAKNHGGVLVLTDPYDYEEALAYLGREEDVPFEYRRYLAGKAFALVSAYDTMIAGYLAKGTDQSEEQSIMPSSFTLSAPLDSVLRYGENPHQQAGFYLNGEAGWNILHGKELSYNNYQDVDSTLRALRLFNEPTVVITKHCNPCGIGSADKLKDAWDKAFAADPLSPYGGIIGLNRPLDIETAAQIDKIFTEIIIASGYEEGVLGFLQKKKNRRVIEYDPSVLFTSDHTLESKQLLRGFLVQTFDAMNEDQEQFRVVTKAQPTDEDWHSLLFGWKVVSLLRSNAIAITGPDRVFGLGSGQTSRIDSTCIALGKAEKFGHDLTTAVCASDGFFPMSDSIDELHKNGIRAVIQPGGSKADEEVIKACDEYGMSMVFTGFRHFRH
jgi:phosphoribosylaminoimidazolecarboxamide formyltransferase / IMP cyclohydrolase